MSSPNIQKSTESKYEIVTKDNITTFKILETSVDEPLSENQKEKLLQFEEEFKGRYTDDDEEYVATVKLGYTTPPLVPSYRPFWNRRRDNKRKWDDRGDGHSHSSPRDNRRKWEDGRSDGHSHFSSYNRQNYSYNNGYRK